MLMKVGTALSVIWVLTTWSLPGTAMPVGAAYGTLTVNPGEPVSVSFGECEASDLLLWELSVDTLSTTFHYLIQGGDGRYWIDEACSLTSHFKVTEEDVGVCKLWFLIDESDIWSATVTYLTIVTKPYVSITDPVDEFHVNQTTVTVSGLVDYWSDEVMVSLDQVHYETAELHYQHWSKDITLTGEGVHTIYVEAIIHWGDKEIVAYDTVTVILDTQAPGVSIQNPADTGLVRSNHVVIQWTSSDENSIALTEMNVDGKGWAVLLSSETYACSLPTGEHTVEIRVTDTAGNQAIDNATFTVDARALSLDGPYFGLPLFGTILGVVLVAAAMILWFRKRRRGRDSNLSADE